MSAPAGGEGAGLLLIGYRVLPPWTVPAVGADPLLPARVVTSSDDLVDAVPDDDAWFTSAAAAAAAAVPSPGGELNVVAVGVRERDAGVVAERLHVDGQLRTPWPAGLPVSGYEVIGLDWGSHHSWLCYGDVVPWAHRTTGVRPGAHGLIDRVADAERIAEAAEEDGPGLPPILWLVAALALVQPPHRGVQ